jgi:acyl-CoA thioester hydrolase
MSDPTPPSAPKKRRPATRKRKPAAKKTAEAVAPVAPEAAMAVPAAPVEAAPVPELIRIPLSVRWRDLDAFNHVNNSKYLSYLEEARLRWLITMPGMGLEDHIAPVVAASNLNYRRPIGWPGDVVVELFVERLGNTSITIGHRIVDAGDAGAVYCDGNVVMVWIDRDNGRAAPLPEFVRTACAAGPADA